VPGNANYTDQQLLDNFRKTRDNEWLGALFERYTLLCYGVCMKYLKNEEEAKDCVQQIFLKAITELHKYDIHYFKSWLYMVAKNHCLMKLREKQGKKAADIEQQQIADETDPTAKYQHLEKDKKLELLGNSLNELNNEQKQCVTLFYLDKKSYQEIAATTGFSIMQVKSYIQNGKRNLKLLLEKKLKSNAHR
jgi:RNA polymerase sigma-70 factor (ECF subfamily)